MARRCRSTTRSSASRPACRCGSSVLMTTAVARAIRQRHLRAPGRLLPPALQLAYCQPTVRGLFLFHTFDEADFARLAVRALLRGRDAEAEPATLSRTRSRTCATASFRPALGRVSAVAGQYVAYTFFKLDPAWRRLPIEERGAGKEAFAEVGRGLGRPDVLASCYSVGGVRPDSDFFLWKITERYEDLGELGAAPRTRRRSRVGSRRPTPTSRRRRRSRSTRGPASRGR